MVRALIKIRGIVQGVGFRPFVHKLVCEFALSGYIINSSSGVELELEGERAELERFVAALPERAPRLAVIENVEAEYSHELKGFTGFEIRRSRVENERNTLISPDIGICDDCLRELFEPTDRRYHYPFINCTNCGPRFTIIKDVPYDRKNTSMSVFPMCEPCAEEYGDINDRRYHAQPDCCPDCGPQISFLSETGESICGDPFDIARNYIDRGMIVAVKGLGGMHLACKVEEETVKRLRKRKQRDGKPFAIMCRDVETVKKLCFVDEAEERILTSYQRPIVLLRKKTDSLEYISENGFVGVMLPYTPLHYMLMREGMDMLVMTSANLSDTPIMFKNAEALEKLRGIADAWLLHDREIQTRCDDSLCWVLDGKEYFARRSRGYVPYPLTLHKNAGSILACGAEQKASFCVSKGEHVFPSQHIGDLKNIETLENYEQQIKHFEQLFDIKPEIIVCDLHPDYLSTEYAEERGENEALPVLRVQHHHAHMASCMADNALDGEVIALVWDGTGCGTDGTIWGGECLIGGYEKFERFGSILPITLIGGDKVTKEPDRTAFSLLKEAEITYNHIDNTSNYDIILTKLLNCPQSSGMGRLFDGVSAILGICRRATYEGQAAVLLEAAAVKDENGVYPYSFTGEIMRYDWRDTVRAVCADADAGTPASVCAARFMNTLCAMALDQCKAAREKSGLNRVVLSGGSFQNMYIMYRLPEILRENGFDVYHHRRVSPNDEGISLGQLMIAQAQKEALL